MMTAAAVAQKTLTTWTARWILTGMTMTTRSEDSRQLGELDMGGRPLAQTRFRV